MELCEQAAVEQDSNRLIQLTREINRLLSEKQNRLDEARKHSPNSEQTNTPSYASRDAAAHQEDSSRTNIPTCWIIPPLCRSGEKRV